MLFRSARNALKQNAPDIGGNTYVRGSYVPGMFAAHERVEPDNTGKPLGDLTEEANKGRVPDATPEQKPEATGKVPDILAKTQEDNFSGRKMSTADVMAQLNKPTTPAGPRTDGVAGVDYEFVRTGRGGYRKYYSDDEKRAMNYKPPTMEWRNNPLMEHSNAQARLAYGLEHSDLDNPNYAKPTTDVSSFSAMDSVEIGRAHV